MIGGPMARRSSGSIIETRQTTHFGSAISIGHGVVGYHCVISKVSRGQGRLPFACGGKSCRLLFPRRIEKSSKSGASSKKHPSIGTYRFFVKRVDVIICTVRRVVSGKVHEPFLDCNPIVIQSRFPIVELAGYQRYDFLCNSAIYDSRESRGSDKPDSARYRDPLIGCFCHHRGTR